MSIFIYRINGGEVMSIASSAGSYLDVSDPFLSGIANPTLPDGPRLHPPKIFIAPNTVRNATQQEIDGFIVAHGQDDNLRARVDAKDLLDQDLKFRKILKSLLSVVLDEVNILRQELNLTERTMTQLRNKIASRIDSGDVD